MILRYLRIAPLYTLLVLMVLPWKIQTYGWSLGFATKLGANFLFLFGFYQPTLNSLLIGGWSLGVEVVFYILFLLYTRLLNSTFLLLLVVVLVVFFQQLAINVLIDRGPGVDEIIFYHQAFFFAAYFVAGWLIGYILWKGVRTVAIGTGIGVFVLLGGLFVIGFLGGLGAFDHIFGLRGIFLLIFSVMLVAVAGNISLKGGLVVSARVLGDITYGLYLIHPIVYFGLVKLLFPVIGTAGVDEWPVLEKVVFAVAVLGVSSILALLSERYIESPIRRWGRRLF